MRLKVIKDFYQHPWIDKVSAKKGQILDVVREYENRYQATFIGEDGCTHRVWIGKKYCERIKHKHELKINS